jgi:hypothetical protein
MKKLLIITGIFLVIGFAIFGSLNSSSRFQPNGTIETEAELDEYIQTQKMYIKHLDFRLQTNLSPSERRATEALYGARQRELENSLQYKATGSDPSRVLVLSPAN